ncbi:MAG: hypothetical protein QXM75_00840 [Candidatus Diapherotrites archaeon]
MNKSNVKIIIVLIIILSLLVIIWQNIPKKPDQEKEVIEADHSFDVDANYYPEPPMTTIYLYENQLVFMLEDLNLMHVSLFVESPTEYCEVTAGEMIYLCEFDWSSDTVTLYDPFGSQLGPYHFKAGEVSENAIVFPFGIRYRYFVSSDRRRFYLLLDSQDFYIQFQKSFSFVGIDNSLDGNPDISYFVPEVQDFEINSGAIAIFEVDSDEDKKSDVKFFVSPKTYFLAEQNKQYKWPVIFWASPKWRGFGLKQGENVTELASKKAPNGTVLVIESYRFIIRMPDKKNS